MIKYISILPIAIYLFFIWYRFGVQKSISESYYILQKRLPKYRWTFIAALVATSLLMILGYAIEQPEIKADTIILFFAGLGICYTASAAEFKKDKITETWHRYGAVGGYILGYAFIIALFGIDSIWFIAISLSLFIMEWLDNESKKNFDLLRESLSIKKRYTNTTIWWAEVIGLLTIYLATIL